MRLDETARDDLRVIGALEAYRHLHVHPYMVASEDVPVRLSRHGAE